MVGSVEVLLDKFTWKWLIWKEKGQIFCEINRDKTVLADFKHDSYVIACT